MQEFQQTHGNLDAKLFLLSAPENFSYKFWRRGVVSLGYNKLQRE